MEGNAFGECGFVGPDRGWTRAGAPHVSVHAASPGAVGCWSLVGGGALPFAGGAGSSVGGGTPGGGAGIRSGGPLSGGSLLGASPVRGWVRVVPSG